MAESSVRIVVHGLESHIEDLVKRLALAVTAQLVEDTPRKTGWARANWIPEVGSPATALATPETDEERAARVPLADAQRTAGIMDVVLNFTLAKRTIFISNGVPYIVKLNAGSSKQQPDPGYVFRSILTAIEHGLG